MTVNFKEKAQMIHDELIEIRRWFHMHPELSFEEVETGKKIAEILRKHGIEVKENVGKTGLIGILEGGKPGKVVGLRADIDALPITEINEVSYKSKVDGKMHACGHDSHMTSLIGAAIILSAAALREAYMIIKL